MSAMASSERFRPHQRIRDPGAFRRAFERRRSASDGAMIVYAVENDQHFARLGISIGRKKVRRAVVRNRIKRWVREVFRRNKAQFANGVDFVVVPRGPELTFAATAAALPALARTAAGRLGRPLRKEPR
jgi:ribonuclease P protein component